MWNKQSKNSKKNYSNEFRLREGNGECHYYIGVEDDGNPLGISEKEMEISIETIEKMVSEIENAKITKIDYFLVYLFLEEIKKYFLSLYHFYLLTYYLIIL